MIEGAKNAKIHFVATVGMHVVVNFQLIYLFNASINSQFTSQIRIFLLLHDHFPLKCNVRNLHFMSEVADLHREQQYPV